LTAHPRPLSSTALDEQEKASGAMARSKGKNEDLRQRDTGFEPLRTPSESDESFFKYKPETDESDWENLKGFALVKHGWKHFSFRRLFRGDSDDGLRRNVDWWKDDLAILTPKELKILRKRDKYRKRRKTGLRVIRKHICGMSTQVFRSQEL
jgi:hypothetical protein